MPNWVLVFYETASGRSPVRDYLEDLPRGEAGRVARGLAKLAEFGTDLRMPDVRRLEGSPLWELRIRGQDQHRVFYVTVSERRVVLLHAFQKKSQATPRREIETAERRVADYLERFGK